MFKNVTPIVRSEVVIRSVRSFAVKRRHHVSGGIFQIILNERAAAASITLFVADGKQAAPVPRLMTV